jgi:four helix bundle protein
MAILHYRELIAWQKAMDLAVEIYKVTRSFPKEEIYGLTNQMRRAAVSIPSNIAEGQGRGTPGDFLRGLRIGNGSRRELETQILLSERLGLITMDLRDSILCRAEEVGRVTAGLAKSIEKS